MVVAPTELNLAVSISVRWWLVKPYIFGLFLFCEVFGTQPDFEKVSRFIVRYGMKIKIGNPKR